jgi:hypothetical protein
MHRASLPMKIAFFLNLLLALVPVTLVRAAETEAPPNRPPLSAACSAWREHISELIDQHRTVGDIDENALFEFILQFTAARDTCSAGRQDVGLRMYDDIALERVHGALK